MNYKNEVGMFCSKPQSVFKPTGGCMKMFTSLVLLMISGNLFSQQQVQYTQFMHNKMALNSSIAGSKGAPVIAALLRQQWIGVEGAPVSQAVTFHAPIPNRRIGLGFVLANDQIGVTRSITASANYAYHIQLKEELYLSAGINASVKQLRINWNDAVAIHQGDTFVPENGESSKMMMNFGTGFLLYSDNFYAGLSAPKLLRNRVDFGAGPNGVEMQAREEIHVYAMAGTLLPLKGKLSLKPALLMKYVENAPIDFDLHASLDWNRRFSLGATYRTGGSLNRPVGESVDVLVGFSPSQSIRLGLSYDYSLTKISQYTVGSIELFGEYTLSRSSDRLTNPRYF